MNTILTVGYRQLSDGRAEPVCEPAAELILQYLWQRTAHVTVYRPHFLVRGALDGTVLTEGRMEPAHYRDEIRNTVTGAIPAMRQIDERMRTQYPFATIAEAVASLAGPRLLLSLDRICVQTEHPSFVDDGSVRVELPRIEYDGTGLRVIVTGNNRKMPFWHWADALIRDRVRDAILEKVAKSSVAPES